MKLYLIRHGDALLASQNSTRPLSELGRAQAHNTAIFLREQKIAVQSIFHSGKLRAQQTAQIIGEILGEHITIETMSGTQPDDSVATIASLCNHSDTNLMLVSHIPFLPKLASALILEHDFKPFIDFDTAGVLCLERRNPYNWFINWLFSPNVMKNV